MLALLFFFIALGLLTIAILAYRKWHSEEVSNVAALFCIIFFMIGIATLFTHTEKRTYIVVPKSQVQVMTTNTKVIIAYRDFTSQFTEIEDLYAIQHADSFKISTNYNIFGMKTDNELETYFTHDTTKGVKQ